MADEAQNRWVTANGLRFHVLDWGNPAMPPLICLHGLASSCRMFDLAAPILAAHYHILAVDQRGHGLSDKPSQGYDFETIAADLDRLIVALGLGDQWVHLVGHSWGAYTALYYAATRPHKTNRTVLIDGGVYPLKEKYPTPADVETGMSPPEYHHRSLADIQQMIQKEWLGAIFRDELMPLAMSIFDTSDPSDVRAHLNREHHMQIAHALAEFNPADYFARTTGLLLVLVASQSDAVQEHPWYPHIQQVERTLPRCKVQWMTSTVHDIPWHRPQELAAAIDNFLDSSSS